MSRECDRAENIYISIYGVMAENADYIQPEHGPDLFLPPEIIEMLTTTALVSFAAGIFSEFGKKIVHSVKFRQGHLIKADRTQLVKELAGKLSREKVDMADVPAARVEVQSALVAAGLHRSVAAKISEEVIREFLLQLND